MIPFKNCRHLSGVLAVAGPLMTILSACSQNSLPLSGGQAQPVTPAEVSFRVRGLAVSGSSEAAAIFAEHGIQFFLPGNFEVGPAPDGQTHSDSLSEQDRELLQQEWRNWQQEGVATTESCQNLAPESALSGTDARISIMLDNRETGLLRIDGGQICGPARPENLKALTSLLISLARKHYPGRFPSECLAKSDALKDRHEETVSCQSDEECAHVDSNYLAIPRGEVQFVGLKNCSGLPRLAAANAALLQSERKPLLAAREAAKVACAAENNAPACSAELDVGFQNHRHPARCDAGKCVPGKKPR